MAFVLQLDLGVAQQITDLGLGAGELQFFYAVEDEPWGPFDPSFVVRVVPAAELTMLAPYPEDLAAQPSAYGSWRIPERAIYEGAFQHERPFTDLPFREAGPEPWRRYPLPFPTIDDDKLASLCRSGFKVGGYPKWVQEPQYPRCPDTGRVLDRLVVQLDPDPEAQLRWGDNGVGYILQSSEEPTLVTFVMQSG